MDIWSMVVWATFRNHKNLKYAIQAKDNKIYHWLGEGRQETVWERFPKCRDNDPRLKVEPADDDDDDDDDDDAADDDDDNNADDDG